MKNIKKFLCIFLASAILLIAASCSNAPTGNSTGNDKNTSGDTGANPDGGDTSLKENTLPISTDNITLSIYVALPTAARQVYNSMAEHPVAKEMMKETGLNLEFVHPPEADAETFFNTMIASDDLPDIIANGFASYPGGPLAAMDDGVLLDATDLIDQYASNFQALIEASEDPGLRPRIMSDDGRYLLFGSTFLPEYLDGVRHGGMLTRQDLLDKAGITELPVTIEEYEKMFDSYKEMGITPWALSLTGWQFSSYAPLASAYGVAYNGFQLKDGKVTYSRTMPEYKEFLQKMNEWVEKGYISADTFNMTDDDAKKSYQAGTAGTVLAGSWENVTLDTVGKVTDPGFELVGLALPRQNKDDVLTTFGSVLMNPDTNQKFISGNSKHPVEAVRFVDYLYRPETMKMTAWGVNTDEYTMWEEKDGKREFTEFVTNNPEVDMESMIQRYTSSQLQGMWDTDMQKIQYEIPQVQQPWSVWSYNTDNSDLIPGYVTRTTEESKEISQIMSDINTYADEMVQRFIAGQESFDKFDDFVAQIEGLGIERACELHQQAYNRYLSR